VKTNSRGLPTAKGCSDLIDFLLNIRKQVKQAGGNKDAASKAGGETDDQLPSSGESEH
jgi:hypothetical protein